jgi:P4 family phage/plasmid primase-like protien
MSVAIHRIQADVVEIERALRLMIPQGQVTELRAIDAVSGSNRYPHVVSGYYDDVAKMAQDAAAITAKGVYFVPNVIMPPLLARSANRCRPAGKNPTTGDHDIARRIRLLIDCDPIRPAGISSTDEEHAAALERAFKIRAAMSESGWAEPIVADSGNGAHLNYAIDQPADDGGLISRCLESLDLQFTDETVKIDTTVHNPARIWKLPGTVAAKGDDTPDRPHRMAKVLEAPAVLALVTREQLEALAAQVPQAEASTQTPYRNGHAATFNLDEFVARQLPDASGPQSWKGNGRKWVLETCPFNSDHTDRSAFIVEQPGGAIGAGCSHNSCTWTWPELRQKLEPKANGKAKRSDDRNGQQFKPESQNRPAGDSQLGPGTPWLFAPDGCTELANARRLVAIHGDEFRYVAEWDKFVTYDSRCWGLDTQHRIEAFGKDVPKALWCEMKAIADRGSREGIQGQLKFIVASESARGQRAMISLVRSEPGIPIGIDQLDADPRLFNCANGTLDLRTGELRPHNRSDYLTKFSPVNYVHNARAPLWEAVVHRAMGENEALIRYLRLLSGYCLTGNVGEQILPVFHGEGANAKSTILNAIQGVLGPYSIQANPSLLMASKHDQHPTQQADLFRVRLAVVSETEANRRISEADVKTLTGGEAIRARRMREDFWQFQPTAKIILVTNHRPTIRGTDLAIWRRIRLVPFNVVIPKPEQDPALPDKLRGESEGILAWMVRGCLEWQRDGLGMPDEVQAATEEYRADEDQLGNFIACCCVTEYHARVSAAALHTAYRDYTGDVGMTQAKLAKLLKERGYHNDRFTTGPNKGRVGWFGIGLLANEE